MSGPIDNDGPATRAGPSPGRVVIIDPDDDVTAMLEARLGHPSSGYDVWTAKTAQQGTELVEQHGADVVLLARDLPDADGLRTLQTLLSTGDPREVIVMTVDPTVEIFVEVLTAGAFDLIGKPFSHPTLVTAKVAHAVAKVQAERERNQLRAQRAEISPPVGPPSSGGDDDGDDGETNPPICAETTGPPTADDDPRLRSDNAGPTPDEAGSPTAVTSGETTPTTSAATADPPTADDGPQGRDDDPNVRGSKIAGAEIDPVTGLVYWEAADRRFREETSRALRYGRPLAVAFIGLDGLQALIETAGHNAANRVLRDVARAITHQIRDVDFLARRPGGEFLLLLPETMKTDAAVVAERIRAAVATVSAGEGAHDGGPRTASVGIAGLPTDTMNIELLRQAGEVALARAEASGDRVVLYRAPHRR